MSAASHSACASGLGRLSDSPLIERHATGRRRDHFATGRVLERHDFGRARERHGRHRERGLVEHAVCLGRGGRVAGEDRADVQVGGLQDLDLGAQDELAQVRGHLAEQVGRQQRVNRFVGLAEARERDDASLVGAAGRHLGPAVRQQAHVVRELALQERHGIGAANAQYAETRQQHCAKSLCGIVVHYSTRIRFQTVQPDLSPSARWRT